MSITVDVDVEDICGVCDGIGETYTQGRLFEGNPHGKCGACDGTGRVLTELGRKVVEMLKRRYRLEDLQR